MQPAILYIILHLGLRNGKVLNVSLMDRADWNLLFSQKLHRCKLYFPSELAWKCLKRATAAILNLLWTCLSDNYQNDDCLPLVFMKEQDAIVRLYTIVTLITCLL